MTRRRRRRRSIAPWRSLPRCSAPTSVSTDGTPLEAVVGHLLRARGWWVAFAESCTGGLATSRLTDVPGSSDYVERSVVAYSNRAKIELLDVPEALIEEHGAVSEAGGARRWPTGIRTRAGVDVGVGITGIAGPGGGTEQKPVGTVCIAVDGLTSRVRDVQVSRRPRDGQGHVGELGHRHAPSHLLEE